MLSSVGIQACSCNYSLFPAKSSKTKISIAPKTPNSYPIKQNPKPLTISSSSLTQDGAAVRNEQREKMKVVVKPIERPRLVLRFVWMDKNIGIAIDQLIPGGRGTIPVSPYYFWPRTDAWEELKLVMETKPWISNQQKVFLLNQATDIINLWQQTGHG